ncbi:hypothetical protein J6590_034152 [Homalodisca vitripennis]|nr:hypothetical protein J6590_034152 [Homalodisca vitripennis]
MLTAARPQGAEAYRQQLTPLGECQFAASPVRELSASLIKQGSSSSKLQTGPYTNKSMQILSQDIYTSVGLFARRMVDLLQTVFQHLGRSSQSPHYPPSAAQVIVVVGSYVIVPLLISDYINENYYFLDYLNNSFINIYPSQVGVNFLNRLSNSIKDAPTLKALKTHLNRYLVSQAFYNAGKLLAFDWETVLIPLRTDKDDATDGGSLKVHYRCNWPDLTSIGRRTSHLLRVLDTGQGFTAGRGLTMLVSAHLRVNRTDV